MNDDTEYVKLARGRRLAYREYGDPDGPLIVYCHGFPSSGREARILHAAAVAQRAWIIAPDRPGYGESDYQPDRTVKDWANDIAELADDLAFDRFALIGVSGGAPYALSCAWGIPERISTCSLVCPLGPIYLNQVLEKMDWAARFNLSMPRHAPLLSEALFGPLTAVFLSMWPQTANTLRTISAPPTDRVELEDEETLRVLNQTIQDGMRGGARGARQDFLLYTQDWGIPLEKIELPIDLWHGEADKTVPVAHGRWYHAHLPHINARYFPNEGHFSLPLRYSEDILRASLTPPPT